MFRPWGTLNSPFLDPNFPHEPRNSPSLDHFVTGCKFLEKTQMLSSASTSISAHWPKVQYSGIFFGQFSSTSYLNSPSPTIII